MYIPSLLGAATLWRLDLQGGDGACTSQLTSTAHWISTGGGGEQIPVGVASSSRISRKDSVEQCAVGRAEKSYERTPWLHNDVKRKRITGP